MNLLWAKDEKASFSIFQAGRNFLPNIALIWHSENMSKFSRKFLCVYLLEDWNWENCGRSMDKIGSGLINKEETILLRNVLTFEICRKRGSNQSAESFFCKEKPWSSKKFFFKKDSKRFAIYIFCQIPLFFLRLDGLNGNLSLPFFRRIRKNVNILTQIGFLLNLCFHECHQR